METGCPPIIKPGPAETDRDLSYSDAPPPPGADEALGFRVSRYSPPATSNNTSELEFLSPSILFYIFRGFSFDSIFGDATLSFSPCCFVAPL
eukprot:6210053-Pleurochrysis_carterae.AAC.1